MRRLDPRFPAPGDATKAHGTAHGTGHGEAKYQARHAATRCVDRPSPMRRRGPVGLAVAVASAAVVTTMVVAPAGSVPSAATTSSVHTKQSAVRTHDVAVSRDVEMLPPVAAPRASRRQNTRHTTLDARTTREPVTRSDVTTSTASVSPLASDGIPVTAKQAYQDAAKAMTTSDPNCQIPWPLVAGIGRVESDHGRFGGAVLRTDGTSTVKILGPVLDGHGTAVITDTDGGALDGNATYDRAMGPMQFIPSTWSEYASDGNGDGVDDPFNIYDAALATAKYLCAAGGNLSTTAGQERAVFSYNHLDSYVREVIGLERAYAAGAGVVVPDGPVNTASLPTLKTSATGSGSAPLQAHAPRAPKHPKSGSVGKTPVSSPTSSPTKSAGGKGSGQASGKGSGQGSGKGAGKGSGNGSGTGGKAGTPVTTPPSSTPPSTGSTPTGAPLTCPAGSHPSGSVPGATGSTASGQTATSAVAATPATTGGDVTAAKAPKLPAGCVPDPDGSPSTGTLQG